MKIAFQTLGCKVNLVESENLKSKAIIEGFLYTDKIEDSDIIVVNSCAVTDNAEKKSYKLIKKLKSKYPEKKIVLTGCLAELKKNNVKDADLIITNIEKDNIFKYIKTNENQLTPISELDYYKESFPNSITDKTRGFLKIQDGCDSFCSYCIIPHLRGKPRSKNKTQIINEFKDLLKKGFKEIVLVGIHIGKYGTDIDTDLYTLLKDLTKLNGDYRIRLSSLELNELTDAMIDLIISEPKICKHLHIPLQGTTDKILLLMNRHYTIKEYTEKIALIKNRDPDFTIGTDIITGFPGEREEDFKEGYKNLLEMPLTYMHIFPFSEREGTKAATMPDKVDDKIKKNRSEILRELSDSKRFNHSKRLFGQKVRVLTEKGNKGLTDNYFEVDITENIANNLFIDVHIVGVAFDGTLLGSIK